MGLYEFINFGAPLEDRNCESFDAFRPIGLFALFVRQLVSSRLNLISFVFVGRFLLSPLACVFAFQMFSYRSLFAGGGSVLYFFSTIRYYVSLADR